MRFVLFKSFFPLNTPCHSCNILPLILKDHSHINVCVPYRIIVANMPTVAVTQVQLLSKQSCRLRRIKNKHTLLSSLTGIVRVDVEVGWGCIAHGGTGNEPHRKRSLERPRRRREANIKMRLTRIGMGI